MVNNSTGIRLHPYDANYPGRFDDLGKPPYDEDEHAVGEIWCAALMQIATPPEYLAMFRPPDRARYNMPGRQLLPVGSRTEACGTGGNPPVSGIDFFPTVLEMAGINAARQAVDGVSLTPLQCRQPGFPNRQLFWHYPQENSLFSAGDAEDIPIFSVWPCEQRCFLNLRELTERLNAGRRRAPEAWQEH